MPYVVVTMNKITAYQRGHFRLTVMHEPFHTMSDLYWVRFIDALGLWTVPTTERGID